jgi:tricorn protease-like protein
MTEDLTTERSRKSKKIVDVLDYLIEEYRIKALASAELDKVIANEKKIIREHIRNTYIKIKEKSKILYNKIKNEININKKVF